MHELKRIPCPIASGYTVPEQSYDFQTCVSSGPHEKKASATSSYRMHLFLATIVNLKYACIHMRQPTAITTTTRLSNALRFHYHQKPTLTLHMPTPRGHPSPHTDPKNSSPILTMYMARQRTRTIGSNTRRSRRLDPRVQRKKRLASKWYFAECGRRL